MFIPVLGPGKFSRMDDVMSNVPSGNSNNMMFILDGLNVFGPDILQQALEEVTCNVDVQVPPITSASVTSPQGVVDVDIRFATLSIIVRSLFINILE